MYAHATQCQNAHAAINRVPLATFYRRMCAISYNYCSWGGGLIMLFFTSPYDQHTLKRRHYDQRVREIEHRTFTPLASPVYNREHGKSGGHLL